MLLARALLFSLNLSAHARSHAGSPLKLTEDLSRVSFGPRTAAAGSSGASRDASPHLHHLALHGLYARTPADFLETQRLVRRLYLVEVPVSNASAAGNASAQAVVVPISAKPTGNVSTLSKAATGNGLAAVFGQSISSASKDVPTSGGQTQRVAPAPSAQIEDLRTISDATYTSLLRYAKFCAASYVAACDNPNGAVLVRQFGQQSSGRVQMLSSGYLAQDDGNREIIVAFQGDLYMHGLASVDNPDQRSTFVQATAAMPMVNLKAPTDAAINTDILAAFVQGYAELDQNLQGTLANKKGYGITFTGHGLGGCFALLAAMAFHANLPGEVPIQVITYGAPRTGNAALAAYADTLFQVNGQARYLRVTHGDDAMPRILNRQSGYEHAGVEIFQSNETIGGRGIFQCSGHEDRRCSGATDTVAAARSQDQGLSSATSTSAPSAMPLPVPVPFLTTSSAEPVDLSPAPSYRDPARPGTQSCRTCLGTECIDCYDDSDGYARQALGPSLADSAESLVPGQSYLVPFFTRAVNMSLANTTARWVSSKIPVGKSLVKRLNATSSAANTTRRAAFDSTVTSEKHASQRSFANRDHQIILGVRFFTDGVNYCSGTSSANTAAPKQDASVHISGTCTLRSAPALLVIVLPAFALYL